MRRHAWLVLLVAGCGAGDDRGRLMSRTTAIVVSPEDGRDFVELPATVKPTMIEVGARVMVVGDGETPESPMRNVLIVARAADLRLGGPATGDVPLLIRRNCLRPAR